MIFRKTSKTVIKKIWRGKYENNKEKAMYRKTTYWLLFIPIYSFEEFMS